MLLHSTDCWLGVDFLPVCRTLFNPVFVEGDGAATPSSSPSPAPSPAVAASAPSSTVSVNLGGEGASGIAVVNTQCAVNTSLNMLLTGEEASGGWVQPGGASNSVGGDAVNGTAVAPMLLTPTPPAVMQRMLAAMQPMPAVMQRMLVAMQPMLAVMQPMPAKMQLVLVPTPATQVLSSALSLHRLSVPHQAQVNRWLGTLVLAGWHSVLTRTRIVGVLSGCTWLVQSAGECSEMHVGARAVCAVIRVASGFFAVFCY